MFCETNLIQEITGFTLDILVFHDSQGAMQLAVVQEKKKKKSGYREASTEVYNVVL